MFKFTKNTIFCIFVGIVIAIVTVNKSISQSNGDEEKLKGYIDNLCLGSFVGTLIICGVFCLNVEKTDSKTQSNEEYNLWLQEYTVSELWDKNIIGGRPV